MTPSQEQFIAKFKVSIEEKNLDPSTIRHKDIVGLARELKLRTPWALLLPFNLDQDKDITPNTIFDLRKLLADAKDPKTPTVIVYNNEDDPKILSKYDENVKEKDIITTSKRDSVIIVSNADEGGVIGVCKTFDTAWNVHKKYRFHDHGEFSNKKVAEEEFDKKGFLLLKSRNTKLFVIIERMKIGV